MAQKRYPNSPLQNLLLLTTSTAGHSTQREAVRSLLRWKFGEKGEVIAHHESGRPFLPLIPEVEISISHCPTDVAVLLGPRLRRIGVDVETKHAQAERLKERFCTPEELRLSRETGLPPILIWCAKEACYKAFSDKVKEPYPGIRVTAWDKENGTLNVRIEDEGLFCPRFKTLPGGALIVVFDEKRRCD